MLQVIYFKENEKDIIEKLENEGLDTTTLGKKLEHLFQRVYNNYVGYYSFNQDKNTYKIIVLPKIIYINDQNKEEKFVNYLLHYLRVNSIYEFDETKKVSNSILTLAFEDNQNNDSHEPLEQFQYYKYLNILDSIKKFFKEHKSYKRVIKDYKSQSIKYKINLQKNIKELDNTKIHQSRIIEEMYSNIATIVYSCLKLFENKKIRFMDNDEDYKNRLLSYTKALLSFLLKTYNIDKSYKINLNKLKSYKVNKEFSKNINTKKLLINIKSLFGFEQMFQREKIKVDNHFELLTSSFFIDPILFYEWYMYDIFKSNLDESQYEILFDKIESQTTKKYIIKNSKDQVEKKSKPDFILKDKLKEIEIIIDAKWKILDHVKDISKNDYLKLKIDSDLRKDKNIISYLIYPLLGNNIRDNRVTIELERRSYFEFYILQIDMNFDKSNTKLDFLYDYKQIEEKIEQDKKESIIRNFSQQFTDEIENKRSEVITKLLNSENIEDKEEVFSELDTILLTSSDKLIESLEENISPEVQKILQDFKDVLHEESKKFLKSSSSIYNYYKDKNFEHFDYSMPASGLWKLVELELNDSFVWYVRIKKNVCDINSKIISLMQNDESFKIGWVELNKFDNNFNNLQSLMLGEIKFLSGNNGIKSLLDNQFISNELFNLLKNVIEIRNDHAHIKSMNIEKFQELQDLLFDESNNLVKLLEMKKSINIKMSFVKQTV